MICQSGSLQKNSERTSDRVQFLRQEESPGAGSGARGSCLASCVTASDDEGIVWLQIGIAEGLRGFGGEEAAR